MDNKRAIQIIKSFFPPSGIRELCDALHHAIKTMQAVEDGRLVEVVRCSECVHFEKHNEELGRCNFYDVENYWFTHPCEGYCNFGRKEE